MIDIGFSELVVIGVVALIVIGPERLPKTARTVGHLFGRLQRYVNEVKADINREMELEELRNLQKQVQSAAQELKTSVESAARDVETGVREVERDLNAGVTDSDPAETARLAEPAPLPNEPGGELADAAPAELPRQPTLPGFDKI
ncbi:MAG TPA: Sec-independent protein translocase protein TatB [Casimicrobiaceae bacterium]|nr:Sec-independent protein translocase protein TatB [Casimicrobiaceae bacterium]